MAEPPRAGARRPAPYDRCGGFDAQTMEKSGKEADRRGGPHSTPSIMALAFSKPDVRSKVAFGRPRLLLIGLGSERRSASQPTDWISIGGINFRRSFTPERSLRTSGQPRRSRRPKSPIVRCRGSANFRAVLSEKAIAVRSHVRSNCELAGAPSRSVIAPARNVAIQPCGRLGFVRTPVPTLGRFPDRREGGGSYRLARTWRGRSDRRVLADSGIAAWGDGTAETYRRASPFARSITIRAHEVLKAI